MKLRFVAVVLAVVAADQLTKLAVVRTLAPGDSRVVIPGVLWLSHFRNPGAAFGLFRGVPGVLMLAAVAGIVAFAFVIARDPSPVAGLAASLVAGGAVGNLLDRAFRPWPFRGTVVDFVDFRVWPAFNVADMAITVGAGLLLIASFKEGKERGTEDADTGDDERRTDRRG